MNSALCSVVCLVRLRSENALSDAVNDDAVVGDPTVGLAGLLLGIEMGCVSPPEIEPERDRPTEVGDEAPEEMGDAVPEIDILEMLELLKL